MQRIMAIISVLSFRSAALIFHRMRRRGEAMCALTARGNSVTMGHPPDNRRPPKCRANTANVACESVAARLSSRRLLRLGRSPERSAGRRLRSRRGPQRPRLRCARRALSSTHRVIAVDMPGRGKSDWLADPERLCVPHLSHDADRARSRAAAPRRVGWVGTSMGGLLGIAIAAQAGSPIVPSRRQRRRTHDRAGRARADPRLLRHSIRRSRPTTKSRSTSRTISAPFGPLDRRAVGPRDANQRPAAPRWSVGPRLRSGHRGSFPDRRGGATRPVAAVGRDPLPDARAPRRAVGPAVGRHGRADDRARPPAAGDRIRRRRPCADAAVSPIRSIRSSGSCAADLHAVCHDCRAGAGGAHGSGNCSAARGARA